ncbi:histidine phosphatase family protein [Numidum massiliense]|uniref:histidine phosphatase family protein n=1 Tax=Numidum massiliense TaxID=1522315 RepID=UPI0006D55E31|nr:histidine phosphatase family protein [Numidum massiliense]
MWGDIGRELGYRTFVETIKNFSNFGLEKAMATVKKLDTLGLAEDLQTVRRRVQEELTHIAKQQAKQGGGNVLVVSHGVSILAMISVMTDDPAKNDQLANASVTKIVFRDGRFDVQTVGDLSYVEAGQ